MSGTAEEFTVDALGNAYTHELNGVTSTYNYHAGTTRLDMMLAPNGIYTDTTRYAYDIDGNRLDETTSHYLSDPTPGFTSNCAPAGDALCINTARSYSYNDENLLEQTYVMIDSTVTHPGYYPYTTDEHFRYDALGRRVWARMNHSANCSKQKPWGGCFNTLLRSAWDGDQLIYEIQTAADSGASLENDSPSESGSYGIVSYVHGAGLDSPLAIYKGGSLAVLPFVNYRGETDMVVCPIACSGVPMPGLTDGLNHLDGGTTSGPTGFYGTLQSEGKTGSGLVYARNRYVDPETGKFTQADPIGLAGGVNAWGFVGGDPVSYSDPFGLCPPKTMAEVPLCTGQLLQPVQGPLEIAGMLVTSLPIAGEEALAAGAVGLSTREATFAEQTLTRLGTKVGNQLSHLDRGHLSIAARELSGFASGWDHVTEVRDAMAGTAQTIGKLKRFLADPALSSEVRAVGEKLLGRASRALDAAEEALRR
ncbi:MAG TPA: RHS repeat-associated core domain-containing protein [Gemmatimonadaceae bacterium]|nr:RHS repeat-associated core domain-containing protein [Gemmatimonadaceae bacterium]